MKKRWSIGLPAILLALAAWGQSPAAPRADRLQSRSAATAKEAVEYLFPEQITLPAGKPAKVALHFRVAEGLHINSHTPGEDYLIPTVLTLPEADGVRLLDAVYPPGRAFALPADPKEKLNVYSGEFIIEARLVAAPGNHLVEAGLRYQACDANACLPPRTLKAAIDVIGTEEKAVSGR
jgi:DsbC/DsbD-like thiol-disulfide interchange protein